jgi:hypothetical protein
MFANPLPPTETKMKKEGNVTNDLEINIQRIPH